MKTKPIALVTGRRAASVRPPVANAAIARELAGWCWSLATLDE